MSSKGRRLPASVSIEPFRWHRPTSAAPETPLALEPAPILATVADEGHAADLFVEDAPSVADAHERASAIERDAFAKGYAHGERSGEEAAAQRGEAALHQLAATIEEVSSLRTSMIRKTERELVRLAIAIAERVVRREITFDRELLLGMARVAIDRLGDAVVAVVHLHPSDYAATTSARINGSPLPTSIKVVSDPMVSRGGCIVRSEFGCVDLGLDAQVEELSRALLGDELDLKDAPHFDARPQAAGHALHAAN